MEENQKNMTNAFAHVKTGQVTFAVRDTSIDGVEIKKDDFMALAEGKIILSNPSREESATSLAKALIDEESEIVTVIYGEDVSEEEANDFATFIEEQFEDVEVEVYNGKQPLYPYILSVE